MINRSFQILNQVFDVNLNEFTSYLCVKVQEKKTLITSEEFPKADTITELMNQARLFQILAQKLEANHSSSLMNKLVDVSLEENIWMLKSSLSFFPLEDHFDCPNKKKMKRLAFCSQIIRPLYVKSRVDKRLQYLAEKVLQKLEENKKEIYFCSPELVQALLELSAQRYQQFLNCLDILNRQINWNLIPLHDSSSSSSSSSSSTDDLLSADDIPSSSETSSSPIRALFAEADLRSSESGLRISRKPRFKVPSIESNIVYPKMECSFVHPQVEAEYSIYLDQYHRREELINLAMKLWGLSYGVHFNPEQKKIIEDSTSFKELESEILPYRQISSLAKITYASLNLVLNKPDVKVKGLAVDISRSMKTTLFTNASECICREGYAPKDMSDIAELMASFHHLEYLIENFCFHFFKQDTAFSLECLCLWKETMKDVYNAVEKQESDPSATYISSQILDEGIAAFLGKIFHRTDDPLKAVLIKRLRYFFVAMDQNLNAIPNQSVLLALNDHGQIIQKYKGLQREVSFEDNCFNVRTYQSFLTERIFNCEFKIISLNSCRFFHADSNPSDPWLIDFFIEIGIRQGNPTENEPKIKAEGFKLIKKMESRFLDCGFAVKFTAQLLRADSEINTKPILKNSQSSLPNKGK